MQEKEGNTTWNFKIIIPPKNVDYEDYTTMSEIPVST